MATRKPWVGGNWKCNGITAANLALCAEFNKSTFDVRDVDVVICPANLHISSVRGCLDQRFNVATQNISKTGSGAFTGEISAVMLKDMKIDTTLVGHSERRQYYGETNEVVADKVAVCQDADIIGVLCVGENLSEREAGKTMDVCTAQLLATFPKIKNWSRIVIAYEPVWAIGTGKVATPAEAQEVHAAIRKLLQHKVGPEVAAATRIVYGGSVSDSNCSELIHQLDIDGFLVGGASLKPSFVTIIETAGKKP